MTHEFSHDPIKVRIVDLHNSKTKQTYVFVGEVPDNVRRELRKLEKHPHISSSVLKKFYGAGWRTVLGLPIGKSGGAEFEIDDDLLKDLSEIDLSKTEVVKKDHDDSDDDSVNEDAKIEVKVETKAEDHSPDEKPDDLLITDADMPLRTDFLAEREETLAIVHAGGVKFIDAIHITPVDDILDLKYKIYAAIGVPIYRQHLWFKYLDRSYPLNYILSIHKQIENIDIERLAGFYAGTDKSLESVEGVPIEIQYYNNKDFIHVSARDNFDILRNIYNKYSTNEFFLVDLNDLIKPNDIYTKLHKDKYQIELIYYGFIVLYWPMITFAVFQDYLKNERSIREVYPELLPDRHSLNSKLEAEDHITAESYESLDDKHITKRIFSSITNTTVSIDNYNQDVDVVLSLRNLFDVLELNDTVTFCKANLLHDNKNVVLRKSYMNEREPKDIQPLNSVMIKIKTAADTNENMRIILFKNGNYVVKTDWREENHMDFKAVIKAVSGKINPIIKMINHYGEKIKYHKVPLVEISKDNAVFTETAMSFYYDDDTTDAKFNVLKNILADFRKAGIIISKENVALGFEYFFSKGMYKYDSSRIEKAIAIDNYYEFLSNGVVQQKWNTIFGRTRLFQVINISSKLKITISGIRDDIEMDIFLMYLKGMLSIYNRNTAHIKVISNETMQTKTKKALKNLKVQDPLLYDFKKIYKSNVIYSKICQKPYQPVILNDDEYSQLPKDRKSKALRYWNFTKQKPVWYSCPNIKYPYVKFIVKQHPKDFCIPCCKKIAMNENVNKKKQEIHGTCMKDHAYTGEKVNLTKGSHYIASYGKNIEPGRISRLPEHTLEPLFFDTYSPEGGIDQECVTADGYYIFGVVQNLQTVDNVGMIHCISHSLNSTPIEFLNDCIVRIKKTPGKFRVLLDGNAGIYFRDVDNLCSAIADLENEDALDSGLPDDVPWNILFISIAYYYFGVNVILFDDQQKESIELILPKGLKNYNEMFPDSHKNLVVLRKKVKYYPIYLFNTEIFKRTGIIDTKLFHNESGLITIIKAVVRRTFEANDMEKIKQYVDLVTVKEFCKDTGVKLVHYYINYSNLCYAVVLNFKDNDIYMPIGASHYPLEKNISLIFTPYNSEYDAKYDDLHKLLTVFKNWNADKSKKAGLDGIYLYPNVEVQQWLHIRGNPKIIGFNYNNTNYFIKDIPQSVALKHADKPIQTLMYHPSKINELIHKVKQGHIKTIVPESLESKLNQSLYEYYLHNIVLMHFIGVFNSQRNVSLRKKINAVLIKTDFNKNLENVRKVIDDIGDAEDIHKIKNIIGRYVTNHHNKKQMITDIEQTYFNFDRISLEKMRGLEPKEIKKQLYKIAAGFVKFGTVKIKSFPNMFMACDSKDKLNYCIGNKLIIDKNKLNEILDVLSSDMANPAKWKWIFNSVFIDRSVDYFRFIRRKNESITIEFVDS